MRSLKSPGSFVLAWVHSGATRDRSRTRRFTQARLGIAAFIRVRVVSRGNVVVFIGFAVDLLNRVDWLSRRFTLALLLAVGFTLTRLRFVWFI